MIAESEEYLNINANKIQVTIKIKAIKKSYWSKIPKKTATPLPPFNLSQSGYKWPKKTNNIATFKYKELVKSNNTKNPFDISINKVANPNFQPLNLSILVAPIFWEPDILGSFLWNIFEIINPDGIEPTK